MRKTVAQITALPRSWLIPRGERALLAGIGLIFWVVTIWQALTHPAKGASVFAFFGLGLAYVIFSLSNLMGGLRIAVRDYLLVTKDAAHPRTLAELLAILIGMTILNAACFGIYLVKGSSFTLIDTISLAIDSVLIVILLLTYGTGSILRHPIAKGWLAIAGKTVPQLTLAGLFLFRPETAGSLALITLLGIDALSGLRFIPTLKAYFHNRKNRHLAGLLLGETGNLASGLLLTGAWLIAQTLR